MLEYAKKELCICISDLYLCFVFVFVLINFSPITLEYAEELLLMADTGRCAVLDVSEVPKERPTGHHCDSDVSDDDDGEDDEERW